MISSILNLANQTLLYNGSLASTRRAPLSPIGEVGARDEERVTLQVADETSLSFGAASPGDKFTESLAARLRETGLAGPGAETRAIAIAAAAGAVINEVKEENGPAAANRLKAEIMREASGQESDGQIGAIVGAFLGSLANPNEATSRGFREREEKNQQSDAAPDKVAAKARHKLENEARREALAESAGTVAGDDDDKAGDGESVAAVSSAIRSALGEIQASGGDYEPLPAEAFAPLVNKVKSLLSRSPKTVEPPQTAAARDHSAEASSTSARNATSYNIYSQYSQMALAPGRLLSVAV
ncbi:MAG: hypothetical protein LBO66_14380 [Deltaproteobacteria bacterium]|jgi:hypothetical protein|nr:hypothetical protein [Deltaproteobacteria bacterium]